MIIEHRGIEPRIDESVFIAPTAVVCGNVNVGPQARVMHGAIINSEASAVKIGAFSIICENAVIRATKIEHTNHPVHIGAHAFISPHATLLGCSIASQAYIATGATVLQGAEVGKGAVVAVGALVHASTKIPSGFFLAPNAVAIGDPLKVYGPGFFLAPNAVAIGDPLKVYGPDDRDAVVNAIKSIAFTRIAFGVTPQPEDRIATMKRVTRIRSKEFESHLEDIILEP
jgi:carbonic anhydrase/acetyltransferase-like protein (isoleucine patch superfamily)